MGLHRDSENRPQDSSENPDIRVLVVDSNIRQSATTRRALSAPPTPFVVSPARQLWSALQILGGVPIDAVLVSLELARSDVEQSGTSNEDEFLGLKALQQQDEERPILVLGTNRELGADAVRAGADEFVSIANDFCPETLRQCTLDAVERRREALAKAGDSKVQAAAPMYILLVEEDELVCRLLRRNLERRGHRVTALHSSHKALDFAKSAAFSFDLLVCDERQAGMEGDRLSRLLRRYAPGLRTLFFCNRSPESDSEVEGALTSEFHLFKPYALTDFGEKIAEIEGRYPWPDTASCAASLDAPYQSLSK